MSDKTDTGWQKVGFSQFVFFLLSHSLSLSAKANRNNKRLINDKHSWCCYHQHLLLFSFFVGYYPESLLFFLFSTLYLISLSSLSLDEFVHFSWLVGHPRDDVYHFFFHSIFRFLFFWWTYNKLSYIIYFYHWFFHLY